MTTYSLTPGLKVNPLDSEPLFEPIAHFLIANVFYFGGGDRRSVTL